MNFQEVLEEINAIPAMPKWTPSLSKMQTALDKSFPDLKKYKEQIFLIAGTNGKGSTAKSLEQLFLAKGYNVGLYTSPHRIRINERIVFNNKEISDHDFLNTYLKIRPIVKELDLSHFEILTLIAVSYFYTKLDKKTLLLLEVGMGGRWDATNAVPHQHSVLCPIGKDHQRFLGDSIEEIAANKFDIIQDKNLVYVSDYPKNLQDLLQEKVKSQNATLYNEVCAFREDFQYMVKDTFGFRYQEDFYTNPLAGKRGFENFTFALSIFSHFEPKFKPYMKKALATLDWPHRFSLRKTPSFSQEVYLSGDHNEAGILSLIDLLHDLPPKKYYILCAITEGRNPEEIFSHLYNLEDCELVLCESPFRAQTLEDYKKWTLWQNWSGQYFKRPEEALAYIKNKIGTNESVLITGSLYLSGYVDQVIDSL